MNENETLRLRELAETLELADEDLLRRLADMPQLQESFNKYVESRALEENWRSQESVAERRLEEYRELSQELLEEIRRLPVCWKKSREQ